MFCLPATNKPPGKCAEEEISSNVCIYLQLVVVSQLRQHHSETNHDPDFTDPPSARLFQQALGAPEQGCGGWEVGGGGGTRAQARQ